MKKLLIFVSFLFLSTSSLGFNPTLFSYQNFWLIKKITSLFQQNNFQANIAVSKHTKDQVNQWHSLISDADNCDNIDECKNRIRILVKTQKNCDDLLLRSSDQMEEIVKLLETKDAFIKKEKNKSLIIGGVIGTSAGIVLTAVVIFACFSNL